MTNFDDAVAAITLDPDLELPLNSQLTDTLRQIILADPSCAGLRLPSSRGFAEELGVSRITVLNAYDQLASEGYVEGRRGAGVFVADELNDPSLRLSRNPSETESSNRGIEVTRADQEYRLRPFQPALPDLRAFPHRAWSRLLERCWSSPGDDLLHTIAPMGYAPLRGAVAAHLSAWRGIACTANEVLITSGSTDAMRLILEALTSQHSSIAVEDPGYGRLWRTAKQSGREILPIGVDQHGMKVDDLVATHENVGAVIATPGRHYPLGPTLPLSRRLELLNWAQKTGAVIVEDDYDSEFRYRGSPLPSLCSLDSANTTIYLGSFSKLFSPGLRLGFLVARGSHLDRLQALVMANGPRASTLAQPALAEFIRTGDFAKHIRKMRRLYAKRQACLVERLSAQLGDVLEVKPDWSGMHLVCPLVDRLRNPNDEHKIVDAAQGAGLVATPIAGYAIGECHHRGLVLGYAAFNEAELCAAVDQLDRAIPKSMRRSKRRLRSKVKRRSEAQ